MNLEINEDELKALNGNTSGSGRPDSTSSPDSSEMSAESSASDSSMSLGLLRADDDDLSLELRLPAMTGTLKTENRGRSARSSSL